MGGSGADADRVQHFERYGTSWMQLDPPRHLTVFSREGMVALCEESGFDVSQVHDDSTAFQFWTSEQVLSGTPLVAEDSHFVNPERSVFSRGQLRSWDREAAQLNARGRGDQAAWVLTQAAWVLTQSGSVDAPAARDRTASR